MADGPEQNDLEELKAVLEKNTQAIEALREMIANMEVLLSTMSAGIPDALSATGSGEPEGKPSKKLSSQHRPDSAAEPPS